MGKSRFWFSDKYKTRKYNVVRMYNFGILNLLVFQANSRF